MEGRPENAGLRWTTPQCPFTIRYVPSVLDDIRLAIVDAFFSLPRGGAEIGGILLGSYGGSQLLIAGHQPLDCEHAFGPGFTLSTRDRALLAGMLAAERPADLRPVGWYHSHTRSEIFLAESDLEIHNAYFPQPWQVALVIKPHTFQPARAGFFFRETGGQIQGSASYLEFQLEPLDVRPAPAQGQPGENAGPRPWLRPGAPTRDLLVPPARTITVPTGPVAEASAPERVIAPAPTKPDPLAEKDRQPVARPQPAAGPPAEARPEPKPAPAPEVEVPRFLTSPRARPWRWLRIAVPAAAAFDLALAGYAYRQDWVPRVLALFQGRHGNSQVGAARVPQPTVGLNVFDNNGQLQIRWDRNSAAVQNGANALLEILETGSAPQAIPLDEAHLRSGSFTYARQTARVDVVLAVQRPGGAAVRESTTFLGKPPDKLDDNAALRKLRDDTARQNAQLESDLKAANELNRKLQKSLSDARGSARARERLTNQAPK